VKLVALRGELWRRILATKSLIAHVDYEILLGIEAFGLTWRFQVSIAFAVLSAINEKLVKIVLVGRFGVVDIIVVRFRFDVVRILRLFVSTRYVLDE